MLYIGVDLGTSACKFLLVDEAGKVCHQVAREYPLCMPHTGWSELLPKPYFVDASPELRDLFADSTVEGITIAAPGFYAPQGRWVRLQPADSDLNAKIESFRYDGRRITNFEMEGSALAGLAALMGHRAATLCTIIAQRVSRDANTDYRPYVERMIDMALDKLASVAGNE